MVLYYDIFFLFEIFFNNEFCVNVGFKNRMIIWFLIDKFMYCINLFKIYFDEVNVVDYLINIWFFFLIFNKLVYGILFKRSCI